MLDGVLVINELVDFAKKFKKSCLMVKVDFEKAYVCVSSEYEQTGVWVKVVRLNGRFSF